MNITKEDLKIMIKMEHLLFLLKEEKTTYRKLKRKNNEIFKGEEISNEDIQKYWNIIEKLAIQRKKRNKKTAEAIAKKRKTNKNYGRSKKEIIARETAKKRRKKEV